MGATYTSQRSGLYHSSASRNRFPQLSQARAAINFGSYVSRAEWCFCNPSRLGHFLPQDGFVLSRADPGSTLFPVSTKSVYGWIFLNRRWNTLELFYTIILYPRQVGDSWNTEHCAERLHQHPRTSLLPVTYFARPVLSLSQQGQYFTQLRRSTTSKTYFT